VGNGAQYISILPLSSSAVTLSGGRIFGRPLRFRMVRGMTLLALDADRASLDSFKDAARALHMPLTVTSDTSADRRALYEAKFILVRPDQFVAWPSETAPDNALEILRKVWGST
jgi:hypothetical protein